MVTGECPEWQRELTVNQPPHGFVGSSPTSPTNKINSDNLTKLAREKGPTVSSRVGWGVGACPLPSVFYPLLSVTGRYFATAERAGMVGLAASRTRAFRAAGVVVVAGGRRLRHGR